jgi:Aminotransferase class-V
LAKAAGTVEPTIAGEGKLDAHKLRADFPIFEQRFHAKRLAYLDSAVSAQKPRQVLDAQREFYETSYTNVHRGVYLLAERATERFEGAREKVRAFINAASTREIVFTRSATEALNLVAYAWGARQPRPRRPRRRDRARAPLELRALAAAREAYRRDVPPDSRRRSWRSAPGTTAASR